MSAVESPRAMRRVLAPASAHFPTVAGPTPPSTSMSLSGNRARSSATFGTQRSMNFCPPLPVTHVVKISDTALEGRVNDEPG